VKSAFPVVKIFGDDHLVQGFIGPAFALGITLETNPEDFAGECEVITYVGNGVSLGEARNAEAKGFRVRPSSLVMERISHAGEGRYFVMVARSPHGQAATWTPVEQITDGENLVVTTAVTLSDSLVTQAQRVALNQAREIELVGVACIGLTIVENEFSIASLFVGPTPQGDWTIEGATTSQYEQHLRAILDLPLGDTRRSAKYITTGFFRGKPGANMYRPYLHLMARTPGLKFHQYRQERAGFRGHVTALGNNLLDLRECVEHALDYLNGDIDE
jgi:5-(carboxyamino)imidazole ribonucleotide synthase